MTGTKATQGTTLLMEVFCNSPVFPCLPLLPETFSVFYLKIKYLRFVFFYLV